MKRCLRVLDDVLAGLEAMHSVGLGHFDVKPSNVVLRRGE
jgi:eukaryotic-like serine/threonine-protein kinase